MAIEKIIEFDEKNKYKVRFELGNTDTSTVSEVELDDTVFGLEREDKSLFSFAVKESYVAEGELEKEKLVETIDRWGDLDAAYQGDGYANWFIEYTCLGFWCIELGEGGELTVFDTEDKGEIKVTDSDYPEGMSSSDFDLDNEAKYEIKITYEKLEEEQTTTNSVTLKCHDTNEQGSYYGTGFNYLEIELTDELLKAISPWFVKNYGKGKYTIEEVLNGEYNDEIREILEAQALDNVEIYDEKASKFYNQTISNYSYTYSCKAKGSFNLYGLTFELDCEPIDRELESLTRLEDKGRILELVEQDEYDNLFSSESIKKLEELKNNIRYRTYSRRSFELEVDPSLCQQYAAAEGIDVTSVNETSWKKAGERVLEKIAEKYNQGWAINTKVIDNIIYISTNISLYGDTAIDELKIISHTELKEDEAGIIRAYKDGVLCDYDESDAFKDIMDSVEGYVEDKAHNSSVVDETVEKVDAELKTCLPEIINMAILEKEAMENSDWLAKKQKLASKFGEAFVIYRSVKRKLRDGLSNDVLYKMDDLTKSFIQHHSTELGTSSTLSKLVHELQAILVDAKEAKVSIEDLQTVEKQIGQGISNELEENSEHLRYLIDDLKKQLSKFENDVEITTGLEEMLSTAKENKLESAESQLVSAWNEYVSLPFEK